MPPRFFGLLMVPGDGERTANLPPGEASLDIYLRCAATSARSFAHFGYEWTLVTDQPDLVRARCGLLGIEGLAIKEEAFALVVPADIPFRLAHFKLELLRKFGSGNFGSCVAVVDLDTVCVAPLPPGFDLCQGLTGYRLSAQDGSEETDDRLSSSLATLLGGAGSREWWGGEFLAGDAAGFAALWEEVEAIWPRYLDSWPELMHAGDEMVLAAAMQRYREGGRALMDAGQAGIVARYWTACTQHRPRPFRALDGVSILHLPADKAFLASWCDRDFDPFAFRRELDRHVRRRIALRRLSSAFSPRLHAPRYR